jgi:hypothetical protein
VGLTGGFFAGERPEEAREENRFEIMAGADSAEVSAFVTSVKLSGEWQ